MVGNGSACRLPLWLVAGGTLVAMTLTQQTSSSGLVAPPGASSQTYYLAFVRHPSEKGPGRLVAIEPDGPAMLAHLGEDNTSLTQVQVYDAEGRELVIDKMGRAHPTGTALSTRTAVVSISATFAAARRAADHDIAATPGCAAAKKSIMELVTPTTMDGEANLLPLETVAADISKRVDKLHEPNMIVPMRCLNLSQGNHARGYLHNLWHRITGTS
jgi:hypothetical protein